MRFSMLTLNGPTIGLEKEVDATSIWKSKGRANRRSLCSRGHGLSTEVDRVSGRQGR